MAADRNVEKPAATLVLPSHLRLGSKLYESRWVLFTVTRSEIAEHLRVDLWDCMAEFFVKELPGGKLA